MPTGKRSKKQPSPKEDQEPTTTMVTVPINIPVPESFDQSGGLNQAEAWPKWMRKFERYRFASGLCNKSQREQVCTLLYSVGDSVDEILMTLRIQEDEITYNELISQLNSYFGFHKNTLFERVKFNRRKQVPGESVETFIQDLYQIAENCGYGKLKDELIRDRIIVGVLDDPLSDRLQMNEDLTLQDAVKMARQAEARKESKKIVRGENENLDVNYVKKKKTWKSNRQQVEENCQWCGHERHPRSKCPAKDVTCDACKKFGHFQTVCWNKNRASAANEVTEVTESEEILPFLGEVNSLDRNDSWKETVAVNGTTETFTLDTGASVSVLSNKAKCIKNLQLRKSQRVLQGPGGTELKIQGTTKVNLRVGDRSITEEVYIVKNQQHSLLSRDACIKLKLIQRCSPVHEPVNSVLPNGQDESTKLMERIRQIEEIIKDKLNLA